jgi:NADPH:quinone reductase-like Zn-dependent oxidoreductase
MHEPERIRETFERLLALYEEGKIEPVIYRTYQLDALPKALEALGSRQSYGKVIVTP